METPAAQALVAILEIRASSSMQLNKLSAIRALLAAAALPLSIPASRGEAAALPQVAKVTVAKDGHIFTSSDGKAFRPFGVTYYRPGTGWAPQVWKQFDPEITRKDFKRMKDLGVNCVRVFLSYQSFYSDPGLLRPEGLRKFDEFLTIAEEFGIYVHPTGPDHWEGLPNWQSVAIEDDKTIAALESFWKLFAARYRGRNVIFAYDLKNEPELGWYSEILSNKWNAWLQRKYKRVDALNQAWSELDRLEWERISTPSDKDELKSRRLLDYQNFREDIADEWTRRQSSAIKSVDPAALVTVGLIQWSVPSLLPGSIRFYSAFRPQRQARFLDFMEIHFYPFANGAYEYKSEADEVANLSYLQGVIQEVAQPGKPVVLAEFGWYGGGKPKFDGGTHPAATEEQQARYCRRVVEVSSSYASGWLNWGFYDQPEATDCSELTGLMTASGNMKAWGRAFSKLATGKPSGPANVAKEMPELDWDACLTSLPAALKFRQLYLESFIKTLSEEKP
jgi:hypothetical protein